MSRTDPNTPRPPLTGNQLTRLAIVLLLGLCRGPAPAWCQTGNQPTFAEVSRIVDRELAQRTGYESGDLITRKDVERVLKALGNNGWPPPDSNQMITDTLPEDAALVSLLSTRAGTTFMRKVKGEELIFDRMDRVSRVSGGRRMLQDIARLPDGEKLAKLKRPHGVPGFLDLLPKNSSGKVRSIKDYDRPTGRIYTQAQLLERLERSYQETHRNHSAAQVVKSSCAAT